MLVFSGEQLVYSRREVAVELAWDVEFAELEGEELGELVADVTGVLETAEPLEEEGAALLEEEAPEVVGPVAAPAWKVNCGLKLVEPPSAISKA